jgi:hypothetical protein
VTMPSGVDLEARYRTHLADVRRRMWFVYAGLALAAAGLAGILYVRFERGPLTVVMAGFAVAFACGIGLAEYGRRTIRAERTRMMAELQKASDPAAAAAVDLAEDGSDAKTEGTGA